ncbi:MAG: D-glycero-beta-D-manno-heptose-7-phosphate kinase [Candidatus Alcyoniella australis]|nr:D-glycero-beta-D-manno-heptose-7-phosphate kinase [Candidatus Alcyoniella australis]
MAESRKRLLEIVKRFSGVRIAVIGDVMLDQFVWGEVDRISPEAPVPVVHVNEESYMLGGAANVANNLRSLGGHVELMGLVGSDAAAEQICGRLDQRGIGHRGLVVEDGRTTTVKTRIIAHSQQVVRMDREQVGPIERSSVRSILGSLEAFRDDGGLDAVIVSDYGKGVVGRSLIQGMRKLISGATTVAVDPKVRKFSLYRGLGIITPNHHEAGQALGSKLRSDAEVEVGGERILKRFELEAVLITRGEQGMSLFQRDKRPVHIPTVARDVFDVTGAGDTVISVLTMARGAGACYSDAALIANYAAGIVVAEVGTATVSAQQLVRELRRSRISAP